MEVKQIYKLRNGFTLVELLVVIAIIGILIAIIIPSVTSSMNRTKDLQCKNNLRQIGTALTIYCKDNRGHLPYNYTAGVAPWHEQLLPYLQQAAAWDGKVLYCPSAAKSKRPIKPLKASYSMIFDGTELVRPGHPSQTKELLDSIPPEYVLIVDGCRNGTAGEPAGAMIWDESNADVDGAVGFRHKNDTANILFAGLNVGQRTFEEMVEENLYQKQLP